MELADEPGVDVKRGRREGWLRALLDVLRSIKTARRPRSLRLCETLQLGEKRQLFLVDWESRRYLIAATQQGFTVLDSGARRVSNAAGEEQ